MKNAKTFAHRDYAIISRIPPYCLTGNVWDVFQDEFLVGNSSLLHRFYLILPTHCFCHDYVILRSLIFVCLSNLELFWHLASFIFKSHCQPTDITNTVIIMVFTAIIIIIIFLSEKFFIMQNIWFACISIKALYSIYFAAAVAKAFMPCRIVSQSSFYLFPRQLRTTHSAQIKINYIIVISCLGLTFVSVLRKDVSIMA